MRLWAPLHYRRSLASRVTLLTTMAVGIAVTVVAFAAYATVRMQSMDSIDRSLHVRASAAATPETLAALDREEVPTWALGAGDVKLVVIDAAQGRPVGVDRQRGRERRRWHRLPGSHGSGVLVGPKRDHPWLAVPRSVGAGRGRTGADPVPVPEVDRRDARPPRPGDAAVRPGGHDQRRSGRLGGGSQRPSPRTPPDHRRRGDRQDRASRPDPDRGQRRSGASRPGVQRDARSALRFAGPATPAGRRCRPRAAYAADLAAHQPRPPRPGGRVGQPVRGLSQGAPRRRTRPDHRDDHADRRSGRAGARRAGNALDRTGRARRGRGAGGHSRPATHDHRRVRRGDRALVGDRRPRGPRARDHQPARQRGEVEPPGRSCHRRAEAGHRDGRRPGPGHLSRPTCRTSSTASTGPRTRAGWSVPASGCPS